MRFATKTAVGTSEIRESRSSLKFSSFPSTTQMCVCECIYVYVYMCAYVYICVYLTHLTCIYRNYTPFMYFVP